MYDIYISNHLNAAGTTIVTTEELLYSVPIANSANVITDPVVKCEMGKTGSFEFSISPVHPFYNRFLQMKTIMRVVYDGDTIFRGRVLTIDTNKMNGTRRVHLEGDLAFLMDSQQEGADEADRATTDIYTYLRMTIQSHNDQMDVEGSRDKQFTLGEVPGHYSSADSSQRITVPNTKFGSSSWRKTQDALSELTKEYGGYFRTRYNASTGVCYLDWLETYFNKTANTQPIKVTENMIDLSDTSEVDNIFTVLIPVGNDRNGKKLYIDNYLEQYHGDNKSITVPQMAAYMAAVGRTSELSRGFHKATDYENAIKDHGIIYKVHEFGDADTQQKLWNYAINWIRDCYNGKIINFTSTALDLHHLNSGSNQKYLVGDQISIIFPDMSRHTQGSTPTETRTITLISVQYNLHNPEKNSYTIGIPNSLLSKSSNSRTNKKKSSMDAQSSYNTQANRAEDKQKIDSLREAAEVFVISKEFNSEEYQQLVAQDPEKANVAVKVTTALVHSVYKATRGEKIWIKTTTHNQKSQDIDSIYKATNNTQWKIVKVYSTQIQITPVEDDSVLPESGTLTWVSGGLFHTTITYNSFEKSTDKRMWVFTSSHDKTVGGDTGSIYKASNNTQWELGSILTNKILLVPLLNSSELPDSGSLTWVSGGTHHSTIVYNKNESYVQTVVSRTVTMTADGNNGRFVIGKAIPDDGSYTDEELALINKFNTSVVLDAANSELNLSSPLEIDASGHIKNFPEVLASMSLGDDEKNGLLKFWNEGKLDDPDLAETLSLKGSNGSANLMESILGKDGTGLLGTIFQNGPSSFVSFLDPTKAGSTSEDDKNVEIKGGGENGGEIGCGKKSDGSGGKRWTISLNKNLVWYEDNPQDPSHPIEHRVPAGTIGAEDYYLEKIPSFVTEFAYINTLLAEYIQTKNLVVENQAFINQLKTENGSITYIYSQTVGATNVNAGKVTVGDSSSGGLYSNTLYYKASGMGAVNMVTKIWASNRFTTKSDQPGKIFLQGKPYSNQTGDWVDIANFNIADTQFYKDAVSAAWNGGGATAHFVCSTSSTTLEPGGSVDLYAYYIDDSSPAVPVRSYYSGTGRYSSLTISAATDQNLVSGNIKDGVTIFGVTGDYTGSGGSYPTGNVHGDSEMWSPTASTQYQSGYEIPAGGSLDFVPWIWWDHGDGTGNWFYGNTFNMKAGTSNPYPTSKSLKCTGYTFYQSEFIYSFTYTSSSSNLFTDGSWYTFHHNSSYS